MSDVHKRWNIYGEADFGDEETRCGAACLLVQNFGLSLASINSDERAGALTRLIAETQVIIRRAYDQGAADASGIR